MTDLALSVVIPAYNEAERISPTLRATHAWLAARGEPFELLVVDDGSRDRTREVVTALCAELPGLRLIASTPNHGKGHVVGVGMRAARGRLRLFMDADNATPVSELPKLVAALPGGEGVAIGSRRAPGALQKVKQPLYRRLWSRLANRVVQAGLLDGIRDTQCGFKLLSAAAAEAVFARAREAGWGFDLEILALARRLGFAIVEVPVDWTDDRRSRIHPIRDALRITREFVRIRGAFRRGDYDLPPRAS